MAEMVEIRTLDGSSTLLPISPHHTIADVKLLLRSSFPSAPDFHLFLRGSKLSEGDRLHGIALERGDFLVMIPFRKRSQTKPPPPPPPESVVASEAADSVWTDLMRDVSGLAECGDKDAGSSGSALPESEPEKRSQKKPPPPAPPDSVLADSLWTNLIRDVSGPAECGDKEMGSSGNVVRKSGSESYLRGEFVGAFGDVNGPSAVEKIRGVLGRVGCLSDFGTNTCLLFLETPREAEEGGRCVCPEWLRRIVKCFYLLNMFRGLCTGRRERLTVKRLEEALSSPELFGVEGVEMKDVEQLAVLCPKVVILTKEENIVPKSGNSVIIFNLPMEMENSIACCKKKVSSLSIAKTVERTEYKFKKDLWEIVKCSLDKRNIGNGFPFSLSYDNLLTISRSNLETSQGAMKRRRSSSSTSRCCETDCLQPDEMVNHLSSNLGDHGQIVHMESINAKLPVYTEIPSCLSENTKAILTNMGITMLYSHQAEAIESSLSGKHVIIATSTSSGKSMCYNLPVIEEMSRDMSSCAIYLFPTKALAQDQLRSLSEMTKQSKVVFSMGIYDGDTSQEHRGWLRDNARLLITNPDMLHMSILPMHRQFERILSELRYVVVDEAHTYTGAFGCHTALILRRLRRVCSHVYGSSPSFIFCSATSANPRDHVMELANLQNIDLIDNDGSPCGPKFFLLWNPPLSFTNNEHKSNLKAGRKESRYSNMETKRSSSIMETANLLAELVQHGLRCIAFCKTRKLSELVLYYTREILKETVPCLVESISCYRAGYSVEDRRKIEAELFCGKLRGVAATNALELGIDVGHVDATLHLGFPGSFASLWQQAGRSGRRAKPSLAIYVAFEGPLDQYFMKFPEKLFTGQVECCRVDAHNQRVLEQQLACAAFEHPLSLTYDEEYFGSSLDSAILSLIKKGYLCRDCGDGSLKLVRYIGPTKNPSASVSIRAIEELKYKVVEIQNDQVIEEIEESRAFFQVYEGAVYMHQGVTYLVTKMDLFERIAFCQKSDLKYYTKTRDYTDVHVVGGELAYPPKNPAEILYLKTTARVNKCIVTTCWFGFYRIWCGSNHVFDRVDLSLPTYSYESEAVWIPIPQSIKVTLKSQQLSCRAGQHAASHALHNVLPLYLMCNPSDISAECANPFETRDIPDRLLLYDKRPGGIGISAQVQHLFNELLSAALELVSACACPSNAGCPNCIQVLSCDEYNEALDKEAAILILKGVIEAEKAFFSDRIPTDSR